MGKSFRGCISYCLEDKKQEQSPEAVFKNRAEVIVFNQCFGDKKELTEQFNDVRALNQKVQKPVLHITLSLSPEDKLEKPKLMDMARECAKEMGFENNQYIAVSHIDTGHQHLHIVANRIGYDGKAVSDSQNYKKITQYCRKMEMKYNLKQVLSPRKYLSGEQRNIPRHDQRKERLQQDIKEALSKSWNYQEFEQRMKEKGYQITKGRGVSFTDEKKVKVKGSEVGYSLQKIEKILELQEQLQRVRGDKVKQEQSSMLQPARTLEQYKQELQGKEHLRHKENHILNTIDILLKPAVNNNYTPIELQKQQEKKKKKKKRRLHL